MHRDALFISVNCSAAMEKIMECRSRKVTINEQNSNMVVK